MTKKSAIPTKEDLVTELKRRPKGLEREIVAFANTKGGKIYIGVDDDGTLAPFSLDNRSRSQLIQSIHNCDPVPAFELEEHDGFVTLTIPEGDHKPYAAPDGFYLRLGASSQKLRRDEILKFLFRENRVQFDKQTHVIVSSLAELSTDLFNPSNLSRYRELAKLGHQLTQEQLLQNLRLLTPLSDGRFAVTNALVLLFGSHPQSAFPQARVITWLMQTPTKILDQKEYSGSLFEQYEQVFNYLNQHLHTAYEVIASQREEYTEFPEFVVRELVLNGLVHRDYFETGSELQIKVFPECLEFSNPGPLLHTLRPEEIFGTSFRRNPIIAEAFQRAGYIERAGTGLLRVKEFFDEASLAMEIKQDRVFFDVVVHRPKPESIVAIHSKKDLSMNDKVLHLLREGRKTSNELAGALQVSDRSIRIYLKELLGKGTVQKERVGRRVYYLAERG